MDLTGKTVSIYGLGVTGRSSLAYVLQNPVKKAIVINRGPVADWSAQIESLISGCVVELFSEEDKASKEAMAKSDLILLSPGIPRSADLLALALEQNIPVWNEIELAYQKFKKPIIAVTGTNGKTTSVTFLGHFFKELGLNAFIGGNIGTPFVEALMKGVDEYDLAVLEMSSFQCESLDEFRPDAAAILNLFPNHGERYDSNQEYLEAKWLIAKKQRSDDIIFCGESVGEAHFPLRGQKVRILNNEESALSELFDLTEMKIVGKHNRMNLLFCWKLIEAFFSKYNSLLGEGVDLISVFQRAMNSFSGVEHRVEYCGVWNQLEIFNDAKSTNWQATLTALTAVKERGLPISLIIGGQKRGKNDAMPDEVLTWLKEQRAKVYFVGESGKDIFQQVRESGLETFYFEDYAEVEKSLIGNKGQGVLLLSPAFPSFDQFSNYAQRGRKFKDLFQLK